MLRTEKLIRQKIILQKPKSMTNRFILAIMMFILMVSCDNGKQDKQDQAQPNFIVFIADDAAWNDC